MYNICANRILTWYLYHVRVDVMIGTSYKKMTAHFDSNKVNHKIWTFQSNEIPWHIPFLETE